MLKEQLDKRMFWDTDFSKLDAEKNWQYIIERVLERGSWRQFKTMLSYYGREKVIQAAKSARNWDELTHNFLSVYFEIPKEDFRCFTWKQLMKEHGFS